MNLMWLTSLLFFALLLTFVLVRNRNSRQWFGYLILNAVLAAILLFVMNGLGVKFQLHIPINGVTIATVGILGVPGLLLLVALKFMII